MVGDRRRGFAWPYLLRRVADVPWLAGSDARDVHSVYGYPGPLSWGCEPGDEFVRAAWSELLATWREQAVVTAFTRFNPLLGNAALISSLPWPHEVDGVPEHVVEQGPTVSIDLTVGHTTLRHSYGRDLRREIDHSRRQGLTTVHDEAWAYLPAFTALYHETMRRNRAATYYFFDEAEFQGLRHRLENHLHLLVTKLDDVVAAAGLFTEWDGIVHWYLVGSSDALRAVAPAKVLLDDAIPWARARGNHVLHLGGGRGGREDSLFWFKSRFSPLRLRFHTGRWILDRDAYRALVEARRSAMPGSTGGLDGSFFPAYRAAGAEPDQRPVAPTR